MKSFVHGSRYLFVFAALVCGTALAGGKPPPDPTPPEATATSASIAAAAALADSDSAAAASIRAQLEQSQRQAQQQGQQQGQGQVARGGDGYGEGGQGVGEVEVHGDQNSYRARALALTLPGLVAAPAVGGDCRIHTRGGGAFSAGVTGGTRLDEACIEKQHCLKVADRLAAYGYPQAAARQLFKCGGVPLSAEDVVPRRTVAEAQPVDLSSYATKGDLERAFRAAVSK